MALEDTEIVVQLARYIDDAMGSEDNDISELRSETLDRYLGELYGNERNGFSTHVTREVFETVEWALPVIMRPFVSGKSAVEFRPTSARDVAQARQETAVVNYWFYDGNEDSSGFLTLYTWIKDFLLSPNGYVSVALEELDDTEHTVVPKIPEDAAAMLEEQLEATREIGETIETELTPCAVTKGDSRVKTPYFDFNIYRTKHRRRVKLTPLAPETVLVLHGWDSLDLDGCPFVCIRTRKSHSDLLKEGYEAADLAEIKQMQDREWGDEKVNRMFFSDESPDDSDGKGESSLKADRHYWHHDIYVEMDVDEDGESERRHIVMIGDKIFENEEVDYQPVVSATAIMMAHKHAGMSLAEAVADLQEVMTSLVRNMLDNIYSQNVKRKYVNSRWMLPDGRTMDALLDTEAEVIPGRGHPGEGVMPEQSQSILPDIIPIMEYMRDGTKQRSGVAPELSLDPSVLKESTKGAFMGALHQASQRIELIVRLFAETGMTRVSQKIHHLLRVYNVTGDEIEVNGQWQQVNPATWRKRSHMKVNVGSGHLDPATMMQLCMQLLQVQREAMPAGLADQKTIYNTLSALIESMNMGSPDMFFKDPSAPGWKPPEPKPDPQIEILQRDVAVKEKKLQHDIDMEKRNTELEQERINLEIAKAMNETDDREQAYTKLDNETALTRARITELNYRATGENHGAAPAKDSSADEYGKTNATNKQNGTGRSEVTPKSTGTEGRKTAATSGK